MVKQRPKPFCFLCHRRIECMNRNSLLLLTAALTSLIFGTACSTRANPAKIRKEYAAVAAALKGHSDGFFLDKSAEASALLDRKWSLQAEWVTIYLDDHPTAAEKQIEGSVSDLDGNLRGNAILLDEGLYGIGIQDNEMGNVFILAEKRKHFRLVWNAKDLRPGTTRDSKALAAWSAQAARLECREKTEYNSLGCGPLFGGFGSLPNDGQGHRRFYVDGTYAEYAGMAAAGQLSVWVWDEPQPRLEFVGVYTYYIDQPVGTRVEGEILRVRVRDQYRTFSTCCDDEGRPMDWNLELTPTGVQDLGYSPVPSPLEPLDEIFFRTAKGIPAGDLATPPVLAKARVMVRRAPKENGIPTVGGLMPPYPDVVRGAGEFCADFEDFGLAFSMQKVNGRPFLTAIKQITRCPTPPVAQTNH